MGKAVGIHPGVAIVALVAGSELFGIWGALFGAPLAGLVQAIVVAGVKEMRVARAEVREAEEEGKTMAGGRINGPTDGRLRTVLTTVARARRHLRPAQRGVERLLSQSQPVPREEADGAPSQRN